MATFSGRCTCGAIRYDSDAEPRLMLNCHCRDCQRASGSAYAAVAVFRRTALRISGEPRYHRSVGDSGNAVERGFCPSCGNPIFLVLERIPDVLGVQAGSLDDPSLYRPATNLFTTSAHAWDVIDPALPQRPRGM